VSRIKCSLNCSSKVGNILSQHPNSNSERTNNEIRLRILHVDDDQTFLDGSKSILELEGNFEVDTALDVDEAFRKLATGHYDIVISDYEMPRKNGLQFLKELREQKNEIPFILFTGKGREEVAIKALNLGAEGYHNKQGSPETVYGELTHSINILVDRSKAKQALEESEKRYYNLMEQASEAILVHDSKGRIVGANQRACKNLGYTKEELYKMTIADIDSEPTENQTHVLLWPRVVAGETFTFESHQKRKDGSSFPVEVSLGPITIGKETLVIGLTRDITERKKNEEKLKDSVAKYREFAESLPEIVFEIDVNGNFSFINRTASKITGYGQDEIGDSFNFAQLIVPDEREKATANIKRLMSGENVGPNEYTLMKKDGTIFPVMVWATSNIIQNKVATIRGIAVDISERKKAEEELRKNHIKLKIMNEKLHVVGGLTRHDVGNKLMVIKTNSYLLKKQIGDSPKLAKYLEEIDSAINSSDRLFEFSRLYEEIGVEELLKVNVAEYFNKAVALFSNLGNVRIVNECQELEVIADSLLGQLFYNLIDNSIAHGEKVTQIRLHYNKDEDGVKLFYEDNGVGIPDAKKPKLFGEGITSDNEYGLGLRLIEKIIVVYGWTITETGEPGIGAKFTITIPKLNKN
jgi:PAS domain S-box-containing protein